MTREQAADLRREVFKADSHCWRCEHRDQQTVGRAQYRICRVSEDPYQCPAVSQYISEAS